MKSPLKNAIVAILLLSSHVGLCDEITLEKIFVKGTFSQKYVSSLESMNDGIHYSVMEMEKEQQVINKYDYEKGKKVSTLFTNNFKDSEGNPIRFETYEFSGDEKLILLSANSERIYRHSRRSEYYVYNTSDKSLKQVGKDKVQLAEISPDSKHVCFFSKNNLYTYDIAGSKEKAVTSDGKMNEIINGAPDWVYEEEFTLIKAYEWSRDSRYIAYYRFNETNVKEFSFPVYGSLYPENYVYKYPKAGEENSIVEIFIHDMNSGSSKKVETYELYEYIPRIQWTYIPGVLSLQCMNREQNFVRIEFADARTGISGPVYEERSQTYFEVQDIQFLKDNKGFLWMSEQSGFNTVYMMELAHFAERDLGTYSVSNSIPLTEGNLTVTDVIGFDEEKQLLYVQVVDQFNPMDRSHMKIHVQDKHIEPMMVPSGVGKVEASKGMKYFVSYVSNVRQPMMVNVLNDMGHPVRTIEENKILQDTLKNYKINNKEWFKFRNRNGDELIGWMIKPANFDRNKKYPVRMYVYGGPGSQTVLNTWGGSQDMWYQYLAQKGYLIVSVDNRGTGARGRAFRDCTYGQLGKLETEDQIDAAGYLSKQTYVDENRIGIWGWSYGGYMSTLCLAKGHDIFKMAIAVAPVTNWRYYDSIYTERYMGLPDKNGESYDENSPINHVDKIKGKYLLVHGSADDNVHFQNSMMLAEALVQADVDFDMAVYPNKNHSIYGGNTRYHLFKKMTAFINENL